MLTISSGFLCVSALHIIKQPLPVGHPTEEALATGGAVSVQHTVGMQSIELQVVVLGVGEELETLLEALSVGQICCSLPTSVLEAK